MRHPRALWLPAVLGLALVGIPVVSLLVRTPWSRLGDLLGSDIAVQALGLSALTSLAAAAAAFVLGVPLAAILARSRFRGRSVLRALITLPMVLPPVVGGAALLYAFGRRGTVGEPIYEATGLVLPFSPWGVILANTFVALPFLVVTVEAGIRNLDSRYESAAATLGAGPWTAFRRVTLPMVTPALLAGTVLAWARALGEFGATVTFAGNLAGRTQTLPLAVFVALEQDRDAALALSVVLVAVSLVVLVALRDRWWTGR
ncbi:MAG: ABC transporter permease [Acidimicrobiia bacterium]|nr:ABC transporter permease [Acidimicrobiia bacterium]MDH5292844.1 ABC transporter permease [Acidimicrobiia bacterium]